jgi:hypothetical protein
VNNTGSVALTADRLDAALAEAMAAAALIDLDPDPAWTWHRTQDSIELLGDLPPLAHPRHRPLMLNGGAALFNLRILIRGLGVRPAVRAVPDPTRRDLVAVLHLEGPRPVTADDHALVAAVLHGVRQRPGYADRVVPEPTAGPPLIAALRRAARAEQTWLALQPGPGESLHNGTQGPGGVGELASTTLIIGTVLDGPGARLQAGQAAQRVVLTAAAAGVPVRSLPEVLDRPADRQTMRELIGGGLWPQAALGSPVQGPAWGETR